MNENIHQKNIDYLLRSIAEGKFSDFMPSQDVAVSYFAAGGGNYLYLLKTTEKKYLARINYYSLKNEWKIKRHEFKVLSLIKELNIAPQPYCLDDSALELDQHVIIVEFIEGEVLKEIDDESIVQLAKVLKKLHNFQKFDTTGDRLPPTDPLPYFCSVFDEFAGGEDKQIEKYHDLKNIEMIVTPYNRVKNKLGTWFSELPIFNDCDNFVLCHADLKLENILAGPKGIHLIDWEGAGVDIPETDIGRLFSGACFTKYQEDVFLASYYDANPINVQKKRIQAVRTVLDFFRIIEDYILLKRKSWDAKKMLDEINAFEKSFLQHASE